MDSDTTQPIEAQAEKIDFLANVMQCMTDAVFVVDGDGKFTFVNQAGSKICGYPAEELVGFSFSSLFKPDVLTQFNHELANAKTDDQVTWRIQSELVHRNGRKVVVDMSLSPLSADSRSDETVWTVRDITEQQRVFEILDRKQKHLEAICAAMHLIKEDRDDRMRQKKRKPRHQIALQRA